MTILATGPRVLADLLATDEVVATTLPIATGPGTHRTLLRQVVPADAGDVLDINAWARVTNDTDPGYTVGVGWHLWAYDCDSGQGSAGPWWQISPNCGDNVDRVRHHMPLAIDTVYRVPDDWPPGHRIVVVLRGDAMSTASDGQSITVDKGYGHLTVRRWTAAAPPVPA